MASRALLARVAACSLFASLVVHGSSEDLVVWGAGRAAPAAISALPIAWPRPYPHTGPTSSASARQKDDYQYDYDEEENEDDYNYDNDYDYGTKKKKKKKKPSSTAVASSSSETNVFNFVRIMIMRLVWGVASLFGFEEPLSEAFNGAFVPPGVDADFGDDGLGLDYF